MKIGTKKRRTYTLHTEPVERVCEHCGAAFVTRRPGAARYCSGLCRVKSFYRRTGRGRVGSVDFDNAVNTQTSGAGQGGDSAKTDPLRNGNGAR